MTMIIVPQATLPISLWPNGAGRKADIAHGQGWLAAFAWLDGDAPFSDYAGMDRTLTLIDGAGFELRFQDAATMQIAWRCPASFDGGAALTCHLPHGPCRVLNVMTRRDTWRHDVQIGAVAGTDAEVTIIVALDETGWLEVRGSKAVLGRWDACVVEGPQDVRGDGVFATLRIRPVAS